MIKCPFRRGGLRFWLVAVALIRGSITDASVLLGTPAIVLGVALHIWAKGCLRQNSVMAISGPYRLVRHPFYLANALIDAGVAAMSGWWVIQLALPLWWLAVYVRVMRREEAHLTEIFGATYQEYMARVPMLLPYRRPLQGTGEGFSWGNRNISEGREIPRALHLIAYPLLFLGVQHLRESGWAFLAPTGAWGLPVAAALAALYGLGWEFERSFKRRRPILPRLLRAPIARGLFCTAVLVAATLAGHWELWTPLAALRVGLAVLAILIAALAKARAWALVAEAAALVGVVALCPWPWLAFAPVVFYAAVILDSRLSSPSAGRAGHDAALATMALSE